MKSWSRSLSITLVVCFIMVTIYSAFQLYALPENMLEALGISELSKLEKARGVSTDIYYILSLDLLIVFMLIFMFSTYNFSHRAESIVYVEKEREEKEKDTAHQRDDDGDVLLHERMEEFREMLEGLENSSEDYFEKVIWSICKTLNASVGVLYQTTVDQGLRYVQYLAGYAFQIPDSKKIRYEFGEGLAGQAAKSGKEFVVSDVPEGYIRAHSGLGDSTPKNLIVLPIKEGENVRGVMEIASFAKISQGEVNFAREAGKIIAGLFAEAQIETDTAQ